jgi:hypothetical protein
MSKEFNVIALALESIKNDRLEELDRALKIMPVERIDDKGESLLGTFLTYCAGYGREDATQYVLDRWKVTYPDSDKISMIARLFTLSSVNVPTLTFVSSIYIDYTFVELFDELILFDSSPQIAIACGRADAVYGNQPHDTYKMLRDQAIEQGNYVIEEFLIEKIAETAPFAKRGDFIKNYLKDYYPQFENKLPTEKELYDIAHTESKKETEGEIIFPSNDEAVELLTEGLSNLGISFEDIERAKEVIRKEIQSEERKKELLTPILKERKEKELSKDRLLFWTFGPSNPLLNQNLNLDTPSARYGGSRMLLFELYDYDEENDYIQDWFTGSCRQCLLRIRNRWDALRKPGSMGGWKYCYCSFECIRKDHEETELQEDRIDILTSKLIDAFEKTISSIGIQDRTL